MKKYGTTLPQFLHAFFHEWLGRQRNSSRHTVLSYRDSLRMFLRFTAGRLKKAVATLAVEDLTATEIIDFLDHVEKERGVKIATRNCRLAAIHSFFKFVVDRDPLLAAQCDAILRIPVKRGPKRTLRYLDAEEVAAILSQPDRSTRRGQRDHTLLALLYNTGARISEVLHLCPSSVRLESPAQVTLLGKGRKERICPLWAETAAIIGELLKRQPRKVGEPIFANRYGNPLGATGVRFLLGQYVRQAQKLLPRLAEKRVSPHLFRHTAAVHLGAAGVDATVIRSWLGHVSLDTTMIYLNATLEMKRKAIEQADGAARPSQSPAWKPDDSLLAWLDSL